MEKNLDIELYNQYKNGNEESFEVLYKKYKNRIQYFVFNIVKDYQKAEDITQDTFMYVLKNKLREDYSFKYYLYLIAKSRAINYLNSENKKQEIDEKYFLEENNKDEQDIIETLIKNENEKKILEEINMLEYKYKTAIYLVKIEGLSYKQASEILGTSIQNVKNFIHRGKVRLRKNLIKGKFYNMNKILKIFIILITMTIFLSGFVYAGITVYKYFCQKTSKGNITEDMNSWFEINNQEMYYTKVSSYNEYLKYKNKWSSILDMSEESFKENFLVIIIATWRMPGIKISNISADTNYLYIEVENDVTELEIEKEEYMVSTIIPRTLDRENIVLKKKTKEITSNAYVKLEELPYNYTTKNAESDGCVVIEDYEIKIESKEKLNKFIENTKNKNDDYIRIYIKNREDIRIYDIEYINREYILYIDETRTNDFGNRKINYVDTYQSINIIKEENELQGLTRIYLENLLGTNIIVAMYNN